MVINKRWYIAAILLQVLDGIFTYYGVRFFGEEAEGNPVVRMIIHQFGAFLALFVLKSVGIALVGFMHKLETKLEDTVWLSRSIKGICSLYLFAAISWITAFSSYWNLVHF